MFQIDIMSRKPVYEQLIDQIETFVLTGILNPGDKIPSVRSLSVELSVNPNTIQKSYTELDRRGLIYSVPGKGGFISEDAVSLLSESIKEHLSELEELMLELALAGITKNQMSECMENAFRKKGELENDKN